MENKRKNKVMYAIHLTKEEESKLIKDLEFLKKVDYNGNIQTIQTIADISEIIQNASQRGDLERC